ncbi:ribosome recycling factor [Candidatus Endowatersipora endosymbiont of Watersipora subatra]|uniref:ribosome recycling factor n=1 Tax=Candidatus Endowatersipora endosymbiont of Watersipora subatra TaxID=3077946 RepID=UPI00312CBFB4
MSARIDLNDIKNRMNSVLQEFQKYLQGLSTGHASTAIFDPIMVEAYGQKIQISQVATIKISDPKLISIQVWDKSMVNAVDKSIREARLGLNPIVEGQNLRIPLPDLSEDRRRELVKVAKDYAENAKVGIRHVRRQGMEFLKKSEKEKEMSQDEAWSSSVKVQKLTDELIIEVDTILIKKEAEIMKI